MTEAVNINVDDDAVLAELSRQGDSTATERLILKYHNRIYNIILKICANSDDAAELTQDTFVKVLENIGKFEGRSGFYTWVFRIAVNLTLNYCKRKAKLRLRSLDTEDDEQNQQAKRQLKEFLTDDSSPDPAMAAQNEELYKLTEKAMMKLTDQQRAVVVLRDIEGMNYARIAQVLDIEVGTVRSRLSRARCNLRKILEAVLQ